MRVSGAIDEICRVASTPLIPGMFRSMTTTSGASSRTARNASVPFAAFADHLNALLLEQMRSPVRNRS